MILAIVSILGVGAIQLSTLGERSARNDRDFQIAWQAAEAALIDAEIDIAGTGTLRGAMFGTGTTSVNVNNFAVGCGNSGTSQGLCAGVTAAGSTPAWLAADFTSTATSAVTARFGSFSNRGDFPSGSTGIRPSKPPRYTIELFDDPQDRDRSKANSSYVFRVTSMGFGPRDDIQGVLQMLYRK